MDDVIRINDRWYVLASSSRADDRTRVLKDEYAFVIFDRHGDIQPIGVGEQGLYFNDTRHLSHFELRVNDRRPMLLNSMVRKDNTMLAVDLTVPDLYREGRLLIHKGAVHVFRNQLVCGDVLHEHLRIENFSGKELVLEVAFSYAADFADIFEVRGRGRERRGEVLPVEVSSRRVVMGYRGLDGKERRTRIAFSREPDLLDAETARFRVRLAASGREDIFLTVSCAAGEEDGKAACGEADAEAYQAVFSAACGRVRQWQEGSAQVFTSNEQFNDWINRSAADLRMLTTDTADGPYPFAGVPWFSTPFGRDGIITALQTLWLDPALARGVLEFLAARQARELDPSRDAEPGKIMHETRACEMAATGEVPFSLYYGSVDATPLFVVLAEAWYQRTGDLGFIERIWPNVTAALDWVETHGDLDGDGLVEYAAAPGRGLLHQGWKDSGDAVFHRDGAAAAGPIALAEVQGYVFAARQAASRLALLMGEYGRASELQRKAEDLRERFDELFWDDELGGYAMALDGEKRPCLVASSNAGHALFSGIARPERARRLAGLLFGDRMYSGWGVRTIGKDEARFNPISYHNGSIWPHDNAIIAAGLARYGMKDKCMRIMTGLFDASIYMDLNRLPELFCGFDRQPGQGPTLYPVACLPQAWAAGAVFMMLGACLGIVFSPERPQVSFHHPRMPAFLDHVIVRNLEVAGGRVDLRFDRHAHDVGITVLKREGEVEIGVRL